MARKSKLNARERQEVVLMLLRREEPAAALARRYGVSENTLYKWREQFVEGGRAPPWRTAKGAARRVLVASKSWNASWESAIGWSVS